MSPAITRPAVGLKKEADEGRFCTTLTMGTCFSHFEQSTPLRLQELTPLAVEKVKAPMLTHSGLSSPQQALPHADCESHLMRGGESGAQIVARQVDLVSGALPEQ